MTKNISVTLGLSFITLFTIICDVSDRHQALFDAIDKLNFFEVKKYVILNITYADIPHEEKKTCLQTAAEKALAEQNIYKDNTGKWTTRNLADVVSFAWGATSTALLFMGRSSVAATGALVNGWECKKNEAYRVTAFTIHNYLEKESKQLAQSGSHELQPSYHYGEHYEVPALIDKANIADVRAYVAELHSLDMPTKLRRLKAAKAYADLCENSIIIPPYDRMMLTLGHITAGLGIFCLGLCVLQRRKTSRSKMLINTAASTLLAGAGVYVMRTSSAERPSRLKSALKEISTYLQEELDQASKQS